MINNVLVSFAFKREAKRLLKKYATLDGSINRLIKDLTINPFLGSPYGDGIYKIRLADKSKGQGKSGGFRVMYYFLNNTNTGIDILLMSIFDKSEKATVKKDEALKKLKGILNQHKR